MIMTKNELVTLTENEVVLIFGMQKKLKSESCALQFS